MLDKKLQSLTVPFITGLAGVMLGASLVSRTDDTITAKTLRIVDEDGNERVLADASGILVSGAEKGDAVQIKAGDRAQMVFRRDGATFLAMGELKEAAGDAGKLDGILSYSEGGLRIGLASTAKGSFIMLDTMETPGSIEDMLNRKNKDTNFVSLSADENGPHIGIGDSSGKTKGFELDGLAD